MSTVSSRATRTISAEGLPWVTVSRTVTPFARATAASFASSALRVARHLLEDLGHRHREKVARVADGYGLHHVEEQQLRLVLAGEGDPVGEGVAGALGEVGGNEDTLEPDHGGPPPGV